MDKNNDSVSADTLRNWLDNNEPVFILDVRPRDQREEWQIPGSHYLDAYKSLNEGDNSMLNGLTIPENSKVVTVCAAGKTSEIAAHALRNKGVEVYSLEGGMKAWSTAWNEARIAFDNFIVIQIRRTGKGCLSYIVFSNEEAAIIDASLPVEVYRKLIARNNLTVRYVMDTHIHADHLSRSKQVAELFKVPISLPATNKVQFPVNELIEATSLKLGQINLQTIATPGHTFESVCIYIDNQALFTGDTLFTDGVGRPDLKSSEKQARNKAALLHTSLKKLLLLPSNVTILPAHTNKPIAFDRKPIATTIGETAEHIPLLKANEHEFVNYLLQKIPPTPANYLTIVEKNITGDFTNTEASNLEAGANRCAIS